MLHDGYFWWDNHTMPSFCACGCRSLRFPDLATCVCFCLYSIGVKNGKVSGALPVVELRRLGFICNMFKVSFRVSTRLGNTSQSLSCRACLGCVILQSMAWKLFLNLRSNTNRLHNEILFQYQGRARHSQRHSKRVIDVSRCVYCLGSSSLLRRHRRYGSSIHRPSEQKDGCQLSSLLCFQKQPFVFDFLWASSSLL
jgi:hypothetical protein